jgi:hypothetical protein
LENQGLHIQSLCHAEDDTHFNITGAIVPNDEHLRRQVRKWLLIDENSSTLMNQELSDLLAKTFNMSNTTSSNSNLHGVRVHSFQIINIAMVNRIFSERATIAHDFTQLSTCPLKTVVDFLNMTSALQTFSVMFSILAGRSPVSGHDPNVLVQILDTIQAKGPSPPFSIQSDVNLALAKIQSLIKANVSVDCNVLNAVIAPYFARVSKDSPSSSSDDPLFPALSAAPTRTDPMETAFYSRQESRPPPRPPDNQDLRHRTTPPDRTVIVPDRRRDSRDSVRAPFASERTRGTPRPCRADSPDPSQEIARLQDEVSMKQAKLARMKAYHQKALLAQTAEAEAAEEDAHEIAHQQQWALTAFTGRYPDSSGSSRSSRRSAASRSS